MDKKLLEAIINCIKAVDETLIDEYLPHEILDIVKLHAKIAVGTGLASGWIPGAGGTIALTASAGAVWSMYYRVNEKLGLPMNKNILKSIATGIGSNLLSYLGVVAVASALSFFPIIGTAPALVIIATSSYILTCTSAYVYFTVLGTLFATGKDPTKMTESELMREAEKTIKNSNVESFMKDAKVAAKAANDRGEFKKQ